MSQIINWIDENPKIRKLNAHIKSNLGWNASLESDKKIKFNEKYLLLNIIKINIQKSEPKCCFTSNSICYFSSNFPFFS